MSKSGELIIVAGPMFAAKTTHLIDRARHDSATSLILKPSMDSRYGGGEQVHSHDGQAYRARLFDAKNPSEILTIVAEYENLANVLIDEVQFCSQEIIGVIEELLVKGLLVVAAGLDLDYKREGFGPMPALMSKADQVVKLTARCDNDECEHPAVFTYAKHPLSQIENVGADEIFGVACAICYDALRGDLE
jgi:thymidine kinase